VDPCFKQGFHTNNGHEVTSYALNLRLIHSTPEPVGPPARPAYS